MLKSYDSSSNDFVKKGNEISLSRLAHLELLKGVLKKGASIRFRAKGFSMSPFIRNEDVITISSVSGIQARFGDIVAFINPNHEHLVVHRITGKKGSLYFIKGDSSYETDGIIPEANILGKVTRIERNGKQIFLGISIVRYIIAFFTRYNLLLPLISLANKVIQPFVLAYYKMCGNAFHSKNLK